MRVTLVLVAKLTWLCLMVSILVWSIDNITTKELSETLKYEVKLAVLLYMGVLSFPLGLIVLFVLDWVVELVQPSVYEQYREISSTLLVSFSCIIGGYFQWFVLLPYLLKKIKGRIQANKTGKQGRP